MKRKNLKLIPYPTQKLKIKVRLLPMGNRINYSVTGDIYCSRNGRLLRKSGTYSRDDLVWNAVFGSKRKTLQFLKNNRVIYKVLPISHLGYKPCDWIKNSG